MKKTIWKILLFPLEIAIVVALVVVFFLVLGIGLEIVEVILSSILNGLFFLLFKLGALISLFLQHKNLVWISFLIVGFLLRKRIFRILSAFGEDIGKWWEYSSKSTKVIIFGLLIIGFFWFCDKNAHIKHLKERVEYFHLEPLFYERNPELEKAIDEWRRERAAIEDPNSLGEWGVSHLP